MLQACFRKRMSGLNLPPPGLDFPAQALGLPVQLGVHARLKALEVLVRPLDLVGDRVKVALEGVVDALADLKSCSR